MALQHLLVACALVSVSIAYNGNYNCASGRDAVVHLFEWKYSDIERECSYLASQGYCAVQISPATEHAVITNPYRPWWERYQPVSYKLDSRGGTQAQLAQMISTCNGLGVRVYADVVINHMTGGGSGTGTGGSSWNGGGGSSSDYGGQSYPGVPYGTNDFHAAGSGTRQCPTSSMNIEDYNNANQVRNCRLSGLRDLAMETSYVRQKVIDLLNSLLALGVAGFRVDACKHMWPEDLQYIFDRLNNLDTRWFPANTPPYVYQEVIDMGTGEPIKASDYTFLGRVKEFKYGSKLSEVVLKLNGQRLAYLENFGEAWGFLNALDAFAFVDNHDNQRGSGAGGTIVTYKQPREYKIAVAYMLAWSYGHVRVMSSYDFSSHDQGPPANPDGSIQDVVCQYDGGPWICEHRWRQIANMVRFHNAALGQPVSNWWDNGFQAIAFSRGNKAWIGINNENFAVTGTYNTGLPAGDYCNVILCSGNRPPCSGESGCGAVTVSSSGQVTVTIQNNDNPIVAIHV